MSSIQHGASRSKRTFLLDSGSVGQEPVAKLGTHLSEDARVTVARVAGALQMAKEQPADAISDRLT